MGIDDQWDADLMDMSKYSKDNIYQQSMSHYVYPPPQRKGEHFVLKHPFTMTFVPKYKI